MGTTALNMHRLLCWGALIWKCGLSTFALNNCIFVSVSRKTRMDTWVASCWVPFVFQQVEWCISVTVSNLSWKGLFAQGRRKKGYTVLPQSCGMFYGPHGLMKVVWGGGTGSIPPQQSRGRNQLLQDAPTVLEEIWISQETRASLPYVHHPYARP